MTVLDPRSGKGKEILAYLTRELNLPRHPKWLELRFAIDEAVTVKCEFMPEATEGADGEGVQRTT
jgi:hypothetical protein